MQDCVCTLLVGLKHYESPADSAADSAAMIGTDNDDSMCNICLQEVDCRSEAFVVLKCAHKFHECCATRYETVAKKTFFQSDSGDWLPCPKCKKTMPDMLCEEANTLGSVIEVVEAPVKQQKYQQASERKRQKQQQDEDKAAPEDTETKTTKQQNQQARKRDEAAEAAASKRDEDKEAAAANKRDEAAEAAASKPDEAAEASASKPDEAADRAASKRDEDKEAAKAAASKRDEAAKAAASKPDEAAKAAASSSTPAKKADELFGDCKLLCEFAAIIATRIESG